MELRSKLIDQVELEYPDTDDMTRSRICELQASLVVIGRALGDRFMMREMDPMLPKKEPNTHPAAEYLASGSPEGHCRITALSYFLDEVSSNENFVSKIREMGGRRFDAVFYELKIASLFIRSGSNVAFIIPSRDEKSCEFLVDGIVSVECKRMSGEWEISKVSGRLSDYVQSATEKIPPDGIGCLFVQIPTQRRLQQSVAEALNAELKKTLHMCGLERQAVEKLAAIVFINEFLETVMEYRKGIHRTYLGSSTVCLWRGRRYNMLPARVRRAIEHPEQQRGRQYWVNYRGMME